MLVTTNIILDTRRMKEKTRSYPVKLRVCFQREPRNYSTIFDLTEEEFGKLNAPRINERLQKIRDQLKSIERTCEDFIKEINVFNFSEFEQRYIKPHDLFKKRKKFNKPALNEESEPFDYSIYHKRFPLFIEDHARSGCISFVYFSYIKSLLQEERIGTALSYQQSYNSIKKFSGNVLFTDITSGFLHQYEKWMLNRGCTRTTIGIKLRALRTMFNEAIAMGIIKKEKCYPFGRRKYKIPTGRNIKKALEQEQIADIYYDPPLNESEAKAKDFWFFCYFGNGMNPKDLVYLKNRDMQEGYISFIRSKTDRATRDDPKHITIYITDDMRKIIERCGNPNKTPEAYLFPIMQDNLNPLKQYELVTTFTHFINDHMENIRQRLDIDKKITTIVSRHSFSTQLKRSGASTKYIQEALGHTSERTTENYLDDFEKEIKKQYANVLGSFKKDSLEIELDQ